MHSSETFYTQFSKTYAQYSARKRAYLSAVNNFIKREAGPIKTMVDVGSGDGKRGEEIARLLGIDNFTIMDNSEGMVNLSKNIPNALVLRVDISSDSFRSENKYDLVLCLWNVLGHVSADNRKTALKNLASLVSKEGTIFLDVNNRYNIAHYGLGAVIKNVCRDIFAPRTHNGDFELDIRVNDGEKIKTIVHIFNPYEIELLFKSAGLKILKREVVDYETGQIRNNFWCGQLSYKLSKA